MMKTVETTREVWADGFEREELISSTLRRTAEIGAPILIQIDGQTVYASDVQAAYELHPDLFDPEA